jgi:AcrR family transcriptional regulator
MALPPSNPTRERILTAAEGLLRRHGPAKTTVADVARALGMSHANVYRHFASKAELRGAVAERWLHAVSEPLEAIAVDSRPAGERVLAWLQALAEAKRRKVHDDPELFANYHALADEAREVVGEHVAKLKAQLARIVADGVTAGEFRVVEPEPTAAALLDATLRFHHPHHVREGGGRDRSAELARVAGLLVAGMRVGAPAGERA